MNRQTAGQRCQPFDAPIGYASTQGMGAEKRVTDLLHRWREGDEAARDQLVAIVYPELQRLARSYLGAERRDHTLQATALVHEAYMRLVDADVDWDDRVHFLAVAARVMRRVLVDHGKARRRQKRGGERIRTTLDERSLAAAEPIVDIVAVDEALRSLAVEDRRQSRVVELHYFGGMTYEEIASVLGLSATTVKRDLRFAKAWLEEELAPSGGAGRRAPPARKAANGE